MRDMKFRAIDKRTGQLIYSDKAVIENGNVVALFNRYNDKYDVVHETVKQFIFTDYNGRDVYEGDIITMHPDFQPAPEFEADFSFLKYDDRWRLVRAIYGNEEDDD